jgi:hypothetical protein
VPIFPSQVAQGTEPPGYNVRISDIFHVCGETPCIFFFMNRKPFVFSHARAPTRTSPRPARRAVSRGAEGPPTRNLLSLSLIVCLYCKSLMMLVIFSPLHRARFRRFCLILCLVFVFLFPPLRWLKGPNHRGTM